MSIFIFFITMIGMAMSAPHPEFSSLQDLCPEIRIEASYASENNFTGSVVDGYKAPKAFMAKAPAQALCLVQREALKLGLTLKIFDGYRPAKAVAFFQAWAKLPETNPHIKELYYPTFTRQQLFEQGYIATRSSHSRGSAVDLTLYDLKLKRNLDMGSGFDYFDTISHTDSPKITLKQKQNRQLLRRLMEAQGFRNFSQEWWHYSFRPEPFPEEYFDFDVE
jgi:zinc D-Ala-D-Ala dipeptidase